MLVAVLAVYFGPAVPITFENHDAHISRIALSHSPLAFLFDRAAYQELSTVHYTPWLLWSYRLDLALVGDVSRWVFLVHQAMALLAMAAAVALVATRLAGAGGAAVLSLALLAGDGTLWRLWSDTFVRHYIEGGLWAALAILAALAWRDKPRSIWWLAATAAFGLSLFAKEVYLLTPALLALWPGFRERRVWPLYVGWSLVACAWLVLRAYMLGTAVGGMAGLDVGAMMGPLVAGWRGALAWVWRLHPVLLVGVVAAWLGPPGRSRAGLVLAAGSAISALPLLFAPHFWNDVAINGPRLFLAPELFLATYAAIRLAPWSRRAIGMRHLPAIALFAVAVGQFAGLSVTRREAGERSASAHQTVARELLGGTLTSDDSILAPPGYVGEFVWVLRRLRGTSPNLALTCLDAQEALRSGHMVRYYDREARRMESMRPESLRCYRLELDPKQISTELGQTQGVLHWSIRHPGIPGTGGVLFLDRSTLVQAPRMAIRLVGLRRGERYRFFISRPDGGIWLGPLRRVREMDFR
jgi:hypothetical protein